MLQRGTDKSGAPKWLLRCSAGSNEDGERQRVTETFVGSEKEAKRRLRTMEGELDRGIAPDARKMSVSTLIEEHLKLSNKLAARTISDYRESCKRYLTPAILKTRVVDVNAWHLETLYDDLARRGLSPQTIHNLHTALSGAFRRAVRWRILSVNPTAELQKPTRKKANVIRALDADQAKRFLAALVGHVYEALFNLALASGCRPGEYLGLRWPDVDFKACTIRIERSLHRKKGGGWELGPPKTPKSVRTIPLPPETMALLRRHRAVQLQQRMVAGSSWRGHGFVFTSDKGEPCHEDNLNSRIYQTPGGPTWDPKCFKGVLAAAKLDTDHRLYDLRHTCATLLLLADSSEGWVKVVSERLGHSTTQLTLDTYSQVHAKVKVQASDHLGRILFGTQVAR